MAGTFIVEARTSDLGSVSSKQEKKSKYSGRSLMMGRVDGMGALYLCSIGCNILCARRHGRSAPTRPGA